MVRFAGVRTDSQVDELGGYTQASRVTGRASWSTARYFLEELPNIAEAVSAGAFDVRAQTIPLTDVQSAWTQTLGADKRIVFLP